MSSTIHYESFEEARAFTDLQEIIKLEESEKSRRLADEAGESLKRTNAYLVSAMVEASVRPNWFQQGSSYVLGLLNVAKRTGKDIMLTASQTKEQLSQQGINTTLELKGKLERSASRTFETVQQKAQDAKAKSLEVANDVKSKTVEATQGVKNKVQESLEFAQDTAQGVKNNIQTQTQLGLEKAEELAQRVKSAGLGLKEKVTQSWESMTHNSLMAFVVLEEEKERMYRMHGENRVYAISNAFRVAGLIKALAPEFYRPLSEPSSSYYVTLLEEGERASRVKLDNLDSTSKSNAAATARLIKLKFVSVSAPIPIAKAQVEEPIHVTKGLALTM